MKRIATFICLIAFPTTHLFSQNGYPQYDLNTQAEFCPVNNSAYYPERNALPLTPPNGNGMAPYHPLNNYYPNVYQGDPYQNVPMSGAGYDASGFYPYTDGQNPYTCPSDDMMPYGTTPYGPSPGEGSPYGPSPYDTYSDGQAPYGPYDQPPYGQAPYDMPPYGAPPNGALPGTPPNGVPPNGVPPNGAQPNGAGPNGAANGNGRRPLSNVRAPYQSNVPHNGRLVPHEPPYPNPNDPNEPQGCPRTCPAPACYPSAPLCGTYCGVSACAIALTIAVIAGLAILIVAISHESSQTHQANL